MPEKEVRRSFGGVQPLALGHLPTPVECLSRIAGNLWVKRDDCTGLATGGNKTRKLEYLVGDALAKKSTHLITAGGVQSNHARQTAAAAAKAGIACHLLLNRNVADMPDEYHNTGNRLLDDLLGATVHVRGKGIDRKAEMAGIAASLVTEDARNVPYVIPVGGSNALGSLGYVNCAFELYEQWQEGRMPPPAYLVTATSSYGTQAGLLAGFALLQELHPEAKLPQVIGVNVDDDREEEVAEVVAGLAREVLLLLGKSELQLAPGAARVVGGYSTGYGVPSESMRKAVLTASRNEGLLLDPVYSGKAFAYVLDLLPSLPPTAQVLFLHTGGSAGLFAYRSYLTAE